MHVVVIHRWKDESAELVQAMSLVLGITAFEVQQRLIGGGPSVVACFGEAGRAGALAAQLGQLGMASFVVDADQVRSGSGHFVVRRFELGESSLRAESVNGVTSQVGYGEVDLLLPGTRISEQSESKTVTERKFSLGRTVLSGGIPLTKTVSRQEEVTSEERTKYLYLLAGTRQLIFRQSGMSYEGFGAAMKLSRELNFAYLTSELRRLSPKAAYDDRLVNRLGQVRLLGPAQNAEAGLDLAAEILGRSLRSQLL
jgi:hypothetical protein